MAIKLPESIYSPDQILVCAEELHTYSVALGQRHRSGHMGERVELSPEAADLLALLDSKKREDDASIDAFRQELESLAETAPVVTLVLAAPATRALKKELTAWLRQNVNASVLVNFHVNPDIAGGLVIRTPNKIYDASFRNSILAKANRFTEILERV